HVSRTTEVRAAVVPDRRPGGAAVDREVDLGHRVEVVVVGVEPDVGRADRGQVGDRRDQVGVLGVADAEEVTVDDREATGAPGEVATRLRIVELPAADGGVVLYGPARGRGGA